MKSISKILIFVFLSVFILVLLLYFNHNKDHNKDQNNDKNGITPLVSYFNDDRVLENRITSKEEYDNANDLEKQTIDRFNFFLPLFNKIKKVENTSICMEGVFSISNNEAKFLKTVVKPKNKDKINKDTTAIFYTIRKSESFYPMIKQLVKETVSEEYDFLLIKTDSSYIVKLRKKEKIK